MADLLAIFDSDFLVVTGAFNLSGAGFASALDDGLAFDDFAVTAVLVAALAAAVAGALLEVFALPAGSTTVVDFFTAGFAIDLPEATLVATDFAFFAPGVVFAGFFIAFA